MNTSREKINKVYNEIISKYPDSEQLVAELQATIEKSWEIQEILIQRTKGTGYHWSIDPNEDDIVFQWNYAEDQEWNNRNEITLKKQLQCVSGEHHWKNTNNVKWCSYCGMMIVGEKRYIPEVPHFLDGQK